MYLTDREDYLNRERTRTSDNTSINNYNCAGWALKTFCWFSPYNKKDKLFIQSLTSALSKLVYHKFDFYVYL